MCCSFFVHTEPIVTSYLFTTISRKLRGSLTLFFSIKCMSATLPATFSELDTVSNADWKNTATTSVKAQKSWKVKNVSHRACHKMNSSLKNAILIFTMERKTIYERMYLYQVVRQLIEFGTWFAGQLEKFCVFYQQWGKHAST